LLEEKITKLELKLKKADYSLPRENQLQGYIDKKLESMLTKIQQLETFFLKQNKEIMYKKGDTRIDAPSNIERMESAINEWINTIEQQLNVDCIKHIRYLRTHWRRR